jgi:hypothetical protein
MKKVTSLSFAVILLLLAQAAFGATDPSLGVELVGIETTSVGGAQVQSGGASAVVTDTMTSPVACTMDAKMCPDGSYVGRTGPNCEFASCPVSTKVAPSPAASGEPSNDVNDVNKRSIVPSSENPLYNDEGKSGTNPMYEGKGVAPVGGSVNRGNNENWDFGGAGTIKTGNTAVQKGNVEMEWKVEEGEHIAVDAVIVRGWDPKKKEEFMSEHKEAAAVHSKQELEHFAQGILLLDEKIAEVQFNPKELSVSYEAEGKLLWFIPMSYTKRLVASGEEGGEVTFTAKKPWWGFLVSGDGDDETATEAKKKHKETIEIASWSFGASNQAMLLKTISDVLKTKHDTVKNSVSNVR